MATTTWTTQASTVPEGNFIIRLSFHADDQGNPVQPDDDTLIKMARISVTLPMTGDAIQTRTNVTRHYRAAAASLPHDGAADGISMDTPAPITTGVPADLTALQTVFSRMKKQVRLDVNGDVEA
ncbi:MAG: hypothetical protein JSV86_10525 [Gemmatimonadota bacterium]|nr:MAG: hypothetical protein JSV86_10525 [Gemmatimonadota bacterium]